MALATTRRAGSREARQPAAVSAHAGLREAAAAAGLAMAVAVPLVVWGPPGVDLAGHLYQVQLWRAHGPLLWDDYWYAGSYHWLTYSPLWAPLASVAGIVPLGLASVGAAAAAFALVVQRAWGRTGRWSGRSFGLVWGATVCSGAYPFLLGAAFALLALLALVWWRGPADPSPAARRPSPAATAALAGFAAASLGALAASPLAFAGLAAAVVAVAAARGRRWRQLAAPLAILVVLGVAELLLYRAFPAYGRYPFWVADLLETEGMCVLMVAMTWRVPRARALTVGFAAYGIAALVVFLVPSLVGANMARLREAAIPLVVLAAGLRAWRPRALCLAAVVGAAAWNLPPAAGVVARGATAVGSSAASWRPAVEYLRAHLRPSYRVEAVDTAGHWAAYRLAGAGIPLVRGWFRQDDFPANAILYRPGPLRPAAYLRWLRGLGVAYVVRTAGPPDFSSAAEDRLLASGRSGLPVVLRRPGLTVYAVPSPTPIVTGPAPARVLSAGPSAMTIRVAGPGTYRVALHWTPYWSVSAGCVSRGGGGMTQIRVGEAGTVRLSFRVGPGRMIATLAGLSGRRSTHCGAP